MREMIDETEE
jgi:transposase